MKTGVETLVEKLVWGRGGESEHLVKNHVWDADQDVEKLFGGGMGNTSENSDDVLSIVLPRFPACFFELPETTCFFTVFFTDLSHNFHRFVTDFSQISHRFSQVFHKGFPMVLTLVFRLVFRSRDSLTCEFSCFLFGNVVFLMLLLSQTRLADKLINRVTHS